MLHNNYLFLLNLSFIFSFSLFCSDFHMASCKLCLSVSVFVCLCHPLDSDRCGFEASGLMMMMMKIPAITTTTTTTTKVRMYSFFSFVLLGIGALSNILKKKLCPSLCNKNAHVSSRFCKPYI